MTISKQEKWFRVKFGFGTLDQVSIQTNELEKALYAQKFGEVVQINGRQINGKYIISITPDFHKYTGWFTSYEPKDSDDFTQIARDCPNDLDEIITLVRERVDYLIAKNQKHLIGKGIDIPEINNQKEVKKLNPELKRISDDLNNKFKI